MSDKDDAALAAHNLGFGNLTFLLIFLFWTLVMTFLAVWHYNHERQAALENARTAARQSFSKDRVTRRWASGHGGVYVPVSATTPPSPYLAHLAERDITTPSGRALTLLNPASISRQLHEIAKTTTEDGYGHITSQAPLRPGNAPDVWEKKALNALTAGAPEWSSLEQLEGAAYLRLMRPLFMEPACLQCHPDIQVGERRGGISVAIPWTPYQTALRQTWTKHILGHGGIWLLGLVGLLFSRHHLHRHLAHRCQVEQHLRRSEEKYRLLTEGTTAIPWEFDIQADRWDYVAPQVTRMLGYQPEEWTDLRFWVDHIHPEDRQRAADYCQTSTARGEDHQFEYRFLKKDGGIAWLRDVVCVEMAGTRPVRMRGVMI
ncbi:MAG: PAS domain-containing protein, partial [Desulfurivibrionaceae bacterium]|nr:PAS domain-containing protein [Desulfurivibrionaceae bacterium]